MMTERNKNNIMNLNIGKKIADFRKEKGVTQEQLADYVGVSFAAVSKWETGQSYPDITLLPDIAEFFESSIDALMGYDISEKEEVLEKIRKEVTPLILASDYTKAIPIILDALRKFPNDCVLLDWAADMYVNRCWTSETQLQDRQEALKYYEKAIRCTKEESQILQIKKRISSIYSDMGDLDKAIEQLEKINASGKYNLDLADLKYKKGEKQDCKRIIQGELGNMFICFWATAGRLANCYEDEGNLEMTIEVQKFHADFISQFIGETAGYADYIYASSCLEIAKYCKKANRNDEMWEYIKKSVHHAIRFDSDPNYAINALKFMDSLGGSFSTSSSYNCCHSILHLLKQDFSEFAEEEYYKSFCQQLEETKKSKTESGIW